MKTAIESMLDGTAIMYRLFIAAICYSVNPNLTILMSIFYLSNFGLTMYYLHLKEQEDREFILMAQEAIKRMEEKSKTDAE